MAPVFRVAPSSAVDRTTWQAPRPPVRSGALEGRRTSLTPPSLDGVDRDERAGQADRLGHSHREEERAAVGPSDFGGHQIGSYVLDDVDAVVGEQHLMDYERFV